MKTNQFQFILFALAGFLMACGGSDPRSNEETHVAVESVASPAGKLAGNDGNCDVLASRPSDVISVSQAANLVKNYLEAYEVAGGCEGDSNNPAGYFLKMEDIEAMKSPGGIRIYFGRKPNSQSKQTHLIKVGVDEFGRDRTVAGMVRDFSAPCPKVCDPFGLLFKCSEKSKDKGMIRPDRTLEEMDVELAKDYTAAWRSAQGIPDNCTDSSSSGQVRSYWISREALNTVLVPEGMNAIGVMLYFGQNTKTKGDRIFLLSVPVVPGITMPSERYENGVLLINKTSPGDLCHCESILARN